MTAVIAVSLALVAVGGTAVVFTDDPARQAVTLSVFGLCLGMLFLALGAPDVSLSQICVGAAIVPLVVLLTIRKIRRVRSPR